MDIEIDCDHHLNGFCLDPEISIPGIIAQECNHCRKARSCKRHR